MERRARGRLGLIMGMLASAICASLYLGCNRKQSSVEGSGSFCSSIPKAGRSENAAATIRYAKGFTLEYRRGYKVLRVLSPWRDARATFTYVLVPHGARFPQTNPGSTLVETPVRRIVVTSMTYVAYFAMLGLEDMIAGIVGGKMVGTPSVAARIRDGRIMDVGDGAGLALNFDMERLLNLQPDLIMTYAMGDPQLDQHGKLQEAGFKVAINAEYMETTPLGRTEWMKFIAAFFDKDAEAERLFADILGRYEAQAAKARAARGRPTVFFGANYRGVWHMPGGGSFEARFLRDAGADYLWKDDRSTGSIPMNVETVIARAKDADIWLNPEACRSRSELLGEDERYAVFRAFRSGRVYNNNAKVNAGGGNDVWETGVAHPDQVLADLVSIIHPELMPSHPRTWYRQLPEKTDGIQ